MGRFRWGIFGTGAVSAKFVAGLAATRDVEASFVASRSIEKARLFAAAMGVPRAIEGYAEAAAGHDVDAIYIATPPAEHVRHALMALEAGVPVLVEKPLAFAAEDAARIAEAARSRGLFAMEAMWTRFLPAARRLKDQTASGAIGEIRMATGSFGVSYVPAPNSNLFDPMLGGGAIAHLGAYPLSIGQWLFGTPELKHATGTIGATGVDEDAAVQLLYPGGVIGSFTASLRAWGPDDFDVMGTHGSIGLHGPIVRPYGLDVATRPPRMNDATQFDPKMRLRETGLFHQLLQRLDRPGRGGRTTRSVRYAGNGYQHQAEEVRDCMLRGDIESRIMPLDDSIAVARSADAIRRAIGASQGSNVPN
ncbi:Gfo/Idh/MocA family oxidoreductase [Sphingomonas montanisoli]|nr:Gfo/Idh/MocA family oxidoreductase [Sphingomonas montanisoli]